MRVRGRYGGAVGGGGGVGFGGVGGGQLSVSVVSGCVDAVPVALDPLDLYRLLAVTRQVYMSHTQRHTDSDRHSGAI